MKKLIPFIAAGLFVLLFAACAEIPTLPTVIPPDPEGVTEPTTWGDSVEVYGSIDKAPFLTPLDIPDFVKVKVSIPEYLGADLTEDNFRVFEDGKAQGFLLFKESEKRSAADIMIILDTTGSMYNAIDGVKASIVNFIDNLKSSGMDVRVGVVPFDDAAPARDLYIDTVNRTWQDLTDLDTAEVYVNQLYATGGGDGPENPYAGVMFAWMNASWRRDAQKIFILITDAPAHDPDDPGDAAGEDLYYKSEVIDAIRGFATLHAVVVPSWYYSESDTDFTSPDDVREIAVETGGLVYYTDYYGNVDLTAIGVIEYVESSWIIVFESNSSEKIHNVNIYFDGDASDSTTDDQGALHLVGVEY